jgi:hypothetical protein
MFRLSYSPASWWRREELSLVCVRLRSVWMDLTFSHTKYNPNRMRENGRLIENILNV